MNERCRICGYKIDYNEMKKMALNKNKDKLLKYCSKCMDESFTGVYCQKCHLVTKFTELDIFSCKECKSKEVEKMRKCISCQELVCYTNINNICKQIYGLKYCPYPEYNDDKYNHVTDIYN
jgi:hypothetical protein